MDWKVEIYGMDEVILENASIMQRISNPDGSKGKPVPLDGNCIEIKTESGESTVPIDKLIKIEMTEMKPNRIFRFATEDSVQFIGTPICSNSEIVITGFTKDYPTDISINDDVILAEKIQ